MKIRCSLRMQAMSLVRRLKRPLRLRGEEGTSLVELAITLPILMTMLTGAASFALGLYSLQQLVNATAQAAQVVASEQGLTSDPCATAVTSVTGALPNWTASKISYSMIITDSSGTAHPYPSSGSTTGSSFSCTGGASEMAANEPVSLTVSYSYSWLPVYKFSPSSALTWTAASMAD